MGQPETAADETAVAEKPLDLAGRCIGRDVKVLGGFLQEQVADAPPHQVGDKTVFLEPVKRPQRIRAHLLSGYVVFRPGNDARLHGPHHTTPGRKSKMKLPFHGAGFPGKKAVCFLWGLWVALPVNAKKTPAGKCLRSNTMKIT